MNIGKLLLILVTTASACSFFSGCSQRGEDVSRQQTQTEEDLQPAKPLDSPVAFMLYLADKAELDGADVLCDLIEALVQSGDKASARKLCQKALKATDRVKEYNEWSSGGHKPYILPLSRIGAVLARVGECEQALETVNKISRQDKRFDMGTDEWHALRRIADGFTQAGDTGQARKICLKVLKSVETFRKPPALAKAKNRNAELHDVVDAVWYAADRARILGRIAESLAKAGEVEKTKELCAEALSWIDQFKMKPDEMGIDTASVKATALCVIAVALAQAGDTKKAIECCLQTEHEVETTKRPRDDEIAMTFELDALLNIAEALVRAGDTGHANKVCQKALIVAKGIGPAKAQRLEPDAAMSAEAVRKSAAALNKLIDRDTIWALCSTAEAFAKTGEHKQAVDICQQAAVLAQQIEAAYSNLDKRGSSGWYENDALCRITKALWMLHEAQKAREVSRIALKAASRLDDPAWKTEFLVQIGKALVIRDGKIKQTFDAEDKLIAESVLASFPDRSRGK